MRGGICGHLLSFSGLMVTGRLRNPRAAEALAESQALDACAIASAPEHGGATYAKAQPAGSVLTLHSPA
jgi:hypothetical protein